MAVLVPSVSLPLPLPLDFLLASSWTWLALSLATIATLLRALSRVPLCRHRPQALLAPPSSIFPAETEQIASIVSDLCLPLQKSHKRRASCKSAPTLQALVQSHGHDELGYPCLDLGFLSCVGNLGISSPHLRKVASTSDIQLLLCGSKEVAPKSACGVGLKLGFLVDSHERVSGISTHRFIEESGDTHHVAACVSRQKSHLKAPPPLPIVPPCFEMQFGWCKVLETKMGAQWQVEMSALSSEPLHAVKLWSIHERNLFDALNVDGTSVRALDVATTDGLACVAQTNGDISHWDIVNQACLGKVFSDLDSVSALCWETESRFAIAGNGNVLKLWDFRSPNLTRIWNGNAYSHAYEGLYCQGHILSIHWCYGILHSWDLRKPLVGCFSKGSMTSPMPRLEAEQSLALWEKLSCGDDDDDDESWDGSFWFDADVACKSSGSFGSRCVSLVRSLSSSGR